MVETALCIYIGFKISDLARRKNQNAVLWTIISIVLFFIAYSIGIVILLTFFYQGAMVANELMKFSQSPLRLLFVNFSGFGGYLLIKYILERMPDKIIKKGNDEE